MLKLFSNEEFYSAKSRQKLPLICKQCKNKFYLTKADIFRAMNPKNPKTGNFCSKNCSFISQRNKISIKCDNCNIQFEKYPSEIKKTKNNFCSKSCAAIYNNAHKTKGTRRSKLESFLESQLTILYPNLTILYNEKSTINSELDIFIPSLNLAFELNGIFHYEPIFGDDKLNSIQNNDNRKIQACLEKKIELCIIDVSSLKYFKPANAQKYLDIITSIIGKKLVLLSIF